MGNIKTLHCLLCLCLLSVPAHSHVRVNSLFSDGMVIQRDKEVTVWGWADDNEEVRVDFYGQTATAVACEGKWAVKLKPMPAENKPQTMTVTGRDNAILIKNILIGEVWLCAGQSNMEWNVKRTVGGDEAIGNSRNDLLRICIVPHNVKHSPVYDIKANWKTAAPQSVRNASAVGYYFTEELQKELGVPVGMLQIAFGGTVIESWMSREALNAMPNKDKYMDADLMKAEYEAKIARLRPVIDAYERAKDSARIRKQPAPARPSVIPSEYKGATTIYNGEICPVVPFAVRGIVWYQGESNAYPKRADTYYSLLPEMIKLWRSDWKEELPFIVIQLAPFRKKQTAPNEWSGIAVVQDAQAKTAQCVDNVALVTTMDCGETDVHYWKKRPVGHRTFLAAMALCYGGKDEYCGPVFKEMKVEGNVCYLSFAHAESGLKSSKDTLSGFAIAGTDKHFHFADARIVGDKVAVSSPEVEKPVAVRYGWADLPDVSLCNKEGLPASPFRTDSW